MSIQSLHDALRPKGRGAASLQVSLAELCDHVGADLSYICGISGDELVIRYVTGSDPDLEPGSSWPFAPSLVGQVQAGTLPPLIADMEDVIAVEEVEPGGAFMTQPLHDADGTVTGALCCQFWAPQPDLTARDLAMLSLFARLVEQQMQSAPAPGLVTGADIQNMIAARAFDIVAQPIIDLKRNKIGGYEALCRFRQDRDTEAVFDAASTVGLRTELEIALITHALAAAPNLPGDTYLSVNAVPETIFDQSFAGLFESDDLSNLVLEITEHHAVSDYPGLLARLSPLREAGLRIAVDDAGIGYSGLHQIIQLDPDIIKLDRALVEGLDLNPAKRAMCAAMVFYADENGAKLVAEGIEKKAEADELRRLGVTHGQGFHFARPVPIGRLSEG